MSAEVTAAAERLGDLTLHPSRPVMLRALDAIHVASAMAWKAKTIVAADRRLRQAAALVRLKVLPEQQS